MYGWRQGPHRQGMSPGCRAQAPCSEIFLCYCLTAPTMYGGLGALQLGLLDVTMCLACVAGIEALSGEVCCCILSVPCTLEVFTNLSAERALASSTAVVRCV